MPFASASFAFTILPSIKSNVDYCSTFRNRVITVRTAYAGWMRRPEEVATMNLSEVEPSLENGFPCGMCDLSKDDFFIQPEGTIICADCVDLWERDREKQN